MKCADLAAVQSAAGLKSLRQLAVVGQVHTLQGEGPSSLGVKLTAAPRDSGFSSVLQPEAQGW